jgi:hypothetical protein
MQYETTTSMSVAILTQRRADRAAFGLKLYELQTKRL